MSFTRQKSYQGLFIISAYFDVIFDQGSSFLFKESQKTKKEKLIRLEPGYFQGHLCQRFMPLYRAKNQNKK